MYTVKMYNNGTEMRVKNFATLTAAKVHLDKNIEDDGNHGYNHISYRLFEEKEIPIRIVAKTTYEVEVG